MGIVHIMERGGEELHEYKKAVKKAKEAIDAICELSEEMEDKYSERSRMRGYRDGEWDDYSERRYRR